MRQRGLALLAGRHWGGPWRLETVEEQRLDLHGDDGDRERVRGLLRSLDEPARAEGPTLFLLSYEACVALDALENPRLPRRPRDPTLGPDVLVRRCRALSVPPTSTEEGRAASPEPAPRIRAPDHAARAGHLGRVAAARELLLDGVIYQANLAHRLEVEPMSFDEGLAFFQSATAVLAPPCAAFVDVPGWGSVVSLSPERFVMADFDARVARTFPIKGTRPRGHDTAEDESLLAELCASEKDAAEHVMIVDLLRNDLGKIAVPGGVTVERLLDVLSVKNVHHLETTISARLRDGVRVSDMLEATVPGGSITGAPKSSAVESICALEEGPRGPYTGVLGLVDGDRLYSSLLIRTWLRPDDGPGSLHVGGGIVVDSEPAAEWQETLDKAAAFSRRPEHRGEANGRPLADR